MEYDPPFGLGPVQWSYKEWNLEVWNYFQQICQLTVTMEYQIYTDYFNLSQIVKSKSILFELPFIFVLLKKVFFYSINF